MDRFIKTLSILIIMLFLLASGIDATLDRLERLPQRTQLSVYGVRGEEVARYSGDRLAQMNRVDPRTMPHMLRRTKVTGLVPAATENDYRWL